MTNGRDGTVSSAPPEAETAGFRRTLLRSFLVTTPFVAVGLLLPQEQTTQMFAVLLGVAAGVYVGFAMQHLKESEVTVQWIVALTLSGLAWLDI